MGFCASCHKEFTSTTGKPQKLCLTCRKEKLEGTWKKQIRNYSVAVVTGFVMSMYAYSQFKSHDYHSMQDVPASVLTMIVAGGLGVMGGLFGLALAMFFHLWHGKSRN